MKARSNSEKGMALIITLMMLAIVTFMAVIFLSLSRRERNAVKVSEEQNISRQMADVGTAKAAAEQIGAMNRAGETFLYPQGTASGPLKNAVDNGLFHGLLQRAKFHYNMNVSRPYENPNGFVAAQGTNLANVSYSTKNSSGVFVPLNYGSTEYMQNVANLLYDPRAPVWAMDPVTGQRSGDFRGHVDLNRNRLHDRSGFVEITGPNGERYNPNGTIYTGSGQGVVTKFIGDPEWVGVLERPDLPHSETNRFIGRYAYLVLPAGKSLDINFIHNRASGTEDSLRTIPSGTNRFSRNMGVGFWEMNLAAFLVDFHGTPTTWGKTPFIYDYDFANPAALGSGRAFQGAQSLLSYRLKETRANLYRPDELFADPLGPGAATRFWNADFVPMTGAGGYVHYDQWYRDNAPIRNGTLVDSEFPARAWFGLDRAERTGEFPDVQKYFSIPRGTDANFSDFFGRFTNAVSSARTNTYDRYAYSRFVAQMGADSKPAIQGKIHLNYTNEPGTISTNLMAWVMATNSPAALMAVPTPIQRSGYWATNDLGVITREANNLTNFFLITANELLRRSLVTNVFIDPFGRWRTNYTIGGSYFNDDRLNTETNSGRFVVNMPVRHDISITNIQIYHAPLASPNVNYSYVTNAEYSAAVHRVLQLAANIYDNMTNTGPQEPYFPSVFRPIFTRTATNIIISGYVFDPVASTFPIDWATEEQLWNRGAGFYPNLNVVGQPIVIGAKKGWPNFNELSVETYVQVTRKLQLTRPSTTSFPNVTNQMFLIGVSNIFGVEAWNSYARNFSNRPITLNASITTDFSVDVTNYVNGRQLIYYTNALFTNSMLVPANTWRANKDTRTQRNVSTNANGNSDFRIPIYATHVALPNSDYNPANPPMTRLRPSTNNPIFFTTTTPPYFESPDFVAHITNRVFYRAVCEDRIIDFVNIAKLISEVDVRKAAAGEDNMMNQAFGNTNIGAMSWFTPLVDKGNFRSPTLGITNQIGISAGTISTPLSIWNRWNVATESKTNAIQEFHDFMTNKDTNNLTKQAPFSPTRVFYLRTSLQANDPFVHYTRTDLHPTPPNIELMAPRSFKQNDELGAENQFYRPWGTAPSNFTMSDPRVGSSDDWQFPIAKLDDPAGSSTYGIPNFHYRFPNIGTLGRVHRGTPWQTVYLKSGVAATTNTTTSVDVNEMRSWLEWSGSWGTHPTNDWKFMDLFTTALTENSARGLLSVNQTNIAAWSAALSGVQVITNSVPDVEFRKSEGGTPLRFGDPRTGYDLVIQPSSIQLSNIVAGINATRASRYLGVFGYMGEILATPELSNGSPFLNRSPEQLKWFPYTDEALEAIPQRILSLLKEDEPRFVVYSFGQTLKPAARSLATDVDFYNLCLNYQVMGEYATKTVMRVEGELRNPNNPLRTVVESFEQLPPFD